MFNNRIKYDALRIYNRFIKLKGVPREIAMGFSLGIIIGMTPFFGVHIVACVSIAALLGWSKITALLGCQITNVFTAPLIYPVNYWVGVKLAGFSKEIDWSTPLKIADMLALMQQSPLILVDLSVGGIILGIPLAVGGYFFAFRMICLNRKRTSPAVADQ